MPNPNDFIQQIQDSFGVLSEAVRLYFIALTKAGFSKDEALYLAGQFQNAMLPSGGKK